MFCCFLCCCKQKVSKYCMSFYSLLLFLAGGFTIYVAVCLFLNVELLGGLLKNESEESNSDQTEQKPIYLNSYIHMFIFISGVCALIVALLGCCTSRVTGKCCVLCFTILLLAFFAVFTIAGLLMISIHLQSNEFVKSYCKNSDMFEELQPNSTNSFNNFFLKIAKEVETGFFSATIDTFSEIDRAFQTHLGTYMCKTQCPCDSRGIIAMSRWSPEQV